MATLSVDVRGLGSTARSLDKYRREAKKQLQYALRDQTRQVQNNAKLGAPEDTGNLMASIKTDFRALDRLYAEVYSTLEYAAAQEFGVTRSVRVSAHKRTITQAFGQKLDSPRIVQVSEHTRQMDIPGQYYFTTAAKYQRRSFKQSMIEALFRARRKAR